MRGKETGEKEVLRTLFPLNEWPLHPALMTSTLSISVLRPIFQIHGYRPHNPSQTTQKSTYRTFHCKIRTWLLRDDYTRFKNWGR